MTLFFTLAAALVLACLLWLLLGLYRSQAAATDQESVNITLARERKDTLQNALANNAIDRATYDYEIEQLAFDLASDLQPNTQPPQGKKGGQLSAGILIFAFLPIASGALYLHLGNPGAITQSKQSAQSSTFTDQAPALNDLLPQLEKRLAASPDDVDGWRLLGRSYLSVNQFSNAQRAFEKALALDKRDVATLAQLAEAAAMTRDGNLAGQPMEYLERAAAIAPDHEHTMWLMAIGQQQAGNHEAALAKFDQLATLARGNSDAMATIDQMRKRSLEATGGSPAVISPVQEQIKSAISVSVTLDAAARAGLSADTAVFIYAKASQGPPMPLAVSRVTVAELPVTVTLDDSMAMIPSMTLSAYPNVTVGARASTSGNPIAQKGDWFGELNDIDVSLSSDLQITIDSQVK